MQPSNFVSTEEDDIVESQEALVAPLLLSNPNDSNNNNNNNSSSNSNSNKGIIDPNHPSQAQAGNAATTAASASTVPALDIDPNIISSNTNTNPNNTNNMASPSMSSVSLAARRLSDPRFCPPAIQGVLYRSLACKSAADALPTPLYAVVTNGKIAALVYVGFHLALFSVWLPFWVISFLITEWGIYAAIVATIFAAGRAIIRFIAFPGASRKVILDIEKEFSKYALRMLVASLESLREAASCLLQAETNQRKTQQMLPPLWRRAEHYRNRVLAVYTEVLMVLFQHPDADSFLRARSGSSVSSSGGGSVADKGEELTRFGNNRLVGDVGNLNTITTDARTNGRELMERLAVIMQLTDSFEEAVQLFLFQNRNAPVSSEAIASTKRLVETCNSLIDFCSHSLHQQSNDDEDEEANQPNTSNESAFAAIKTGLGSILPMIDPSPHPSIFCLDMQRGCVLSRYRGARQFWVRRKNGEGMIDVLHIPAKPQESPPPSDSTNKKYNSRAVLYCNPNAGLIEVSTGLSLIGGNVPATEDDTTAPKDSWTDFYTEQGIDVYLFNYAGYGRSYGTNCSFPSLSPPSSSANDGESIIARVARILNSCFFAFQPRPDTLRDDGVAVADYILEQGSVNHLMIHGESIGGMTASGVAKHLTTSSSTRNKVSMLVCDRTFCNLEAVAQRLVGQWTGYAIRALTFFVWSTDVAGDFLGATCPKVVAQDAADAIIADEASLKSGIAIWKEIHRGLSSTHGIAWMRETPLRYRMSDFENSSVNDSKYMASAYRHIQAPTWPTDKHVSIEEAFHFAACCKRIGKMATAIKREMTALSADDDGSVTITSPSSDSSIPLPIQAWMKLATCDGMVGAPLGTSVKRGFDATVSWLCTTLVFGGQALVSAAEQRLGGPLGGNATVSIEPLDFDQRPAGLTTSDFAQVSPIPEVALELEKMLETGDANIENLKHEFQFVAAMLRYVQTRLSAPPSMDLAWKNRQMTVSGDNSIGSFMKLNCGHNAAFLPEEKHRLKQLIQQSIRVSQSGTPL